MKHKSLLFFLALFLFSGTVLVACKKDKVPTPTVDANCPDTILFSTQIFPMMQTNCTSCHDSGNSTGYTITNHTNIAANATAILNAMKAQGGMQLMPQGGPALNDSLIQQFTCWVNQGKMNN